MARVNPQAEQLTRENEMLRRQIEQMRADPGDVPFTACSNSCVVARPRGMATNGGCRCDERTLRRAVKYWRAVAVHRQAIIQMMREEEPFLRVEQPEEEVARLREALGLAVHEMILAGWSSVEIREAVGSVAQDFLEGG